MYRPSGHQTLPLFPELFPFGGSLRQDNRLVKLADLVPWGELEELYRGYFSEWRGRPAKDSRLICGLLIVKHIDKDSDRGVVEKFIENPYVQYFCGYEHFVTDDMIHPSLLSVMRKRLGSTFFKEFEKNLIKVLVEEKILKAGDHLMDATVVPANIEFPMDTRILNRCREWLVMVIKGMRRKMGIKEKIRTYREVAEKFFVSFAKKRKKTKAMIRLARGKMLRFVRRNIKQLSFLLKDYGGRLKKQEREKIMKRLEVVRVIYDQQWEMWKKKLITVKDRIVSLHLPHIRPIVRGKEGKDVEFGPKVLLSWVGRFCFLDYLGFDAYNEAQNLFDSLEKYKERFGKYPDSFTGDTIFGNRANRLLLKSLNIRGGFKALGKATHLGVNKQWHRKMQRMRGSLMEGIIGNGKNHYGLDRILYTIAGGEEIWTRMSLMGMNLVTALAIMRKMEAKGAKA